ncbi:prickle-like protein 4 [Erethizon dorsatum]
MLEEVAALGPEGEQPILATFHRKPDLRDRTGRKQTLPPVSVLNSGWPDPEDGPISREPGPPVHSDSDSGQLPEEDPTDTSAQDPAAPSMYPPLRDTSLSNWPGVWTLLQQLPPQDSDERYCLALGEEELAELRLFCAQRKQKALGQGVARLVPPELEGHTCEKCRQQLKPGEVGVFAAPEGEQCCWHRPCFACQACGQVLMHLIYFYHNGRLYCGRHHAELLWPRCPACDQLIFSQRYTEAEGRHWHENHFCCQDCAGPLAGGRYALPGGSPCCPSCFESRYSDAGLSPQRAPEEWAPPAAALTSPRTPHPRLGGLQLSPRSEGLPSLPGDSVGRRRRTRSLGAGTRRRGAKGRADRGGAPGPDRSGGSARAPGTAVAQVPRGSPDTPRGRGRPDASRDPEESAPCPTCSSSSDSEPEGFFLGRRLPRPRKIPEESDASGKRCSVC